MTATTKLPVWAKAAILLLCGLALCLPASSQTGPVQGICQFGGVTPSTFGNLASQPFLATYPGCTVTVFLTGTSTLATIYSTATNTPLSNPFTASSTTGAWLFWSALNVGVDVQMSGGTPTAMPSPYTLTDVFPQSAGAGLCSVSGAALPPTIRCVTSGTAGGDLGAKVNTADAALGSSAGEIWIDPTAGTTWTTATTFSGPRVVHLIGPASYSIPLGNINMPFATLLDCLGRQQVTLNFTGNSGVAFLAKWNQGGGASPGGSFPDWGYGIRNCTLYGPGGQFGNNANAGTGVQVGDATHPTAGLYLDNVQVAGFAIGITWGNVNAWGTRIANSQFYDNGTWSGGVQQTAANFLFNLAVSGGIENVALDHVTFHQFNGTPPVMANDFTVSGTSVLELTCVACSFDTSQRVLGGSPVNSLNFISSHYEVNFTLNTIPLVVTSGKVTEESPRYQFDCIGTCPLEGVSVSGGSYTISNGWWNAQPGGPIANTIVKSGTGNVYTYNGTVFQQNISAGVSNGGSGIYQDIEPLVGNFAIFPGSLQGASLTLNSATPTGVGSNLGLGATTGFGTGAAGTGITTTTKGGGSGPTTAQTVVRYLQIDIGGTKYWVPLMQ